MSKELLIKSAQLFENAEGLNSWVSFYEFANQKESIKNMWFGKCYNLLVKHFNTNMAKGWTWRESTPMWYLEEFGAESLGIWLEGWHKFSLWASESVYESGVINDMLKSSEYSEITNCFERVDNRFNSGYKIVELGNFSFNTEIDGKYDNDSISWQAGNNTELFVNQIIKKVERITKNAEVTEMIRQINLKSKKQQ